MVTRRLRSRLLRNDNAAAAPRLLATKYSSNAQVQAGVTTLQAHILSTLFAPNDALL
jgi:hypothetical protein